MEYACLDGAYWRCLHIGPARLRHFVSVLVGGGRFQSISGLGRNRIQQSAIADGHLVANIAVIAVVILAVTLSRVLLKDYLALRWPSWRLLVIGWVLTVAMLALADFVTTQSGREVIPEVMSDTYANSREAGMGGFFLLGLTLIVIAPLGEEIVFRGFFYRGLNSGFGPLAAIIVTAACWAALHAQYEPFFMAQIFTYALFLGWMRWQSNSLVLVIFLHALNNALALGQTNLV